MKDRNLYIQKFGGTSIGGVSRINNVIGIIDDYRNNRDANLAVVVSAFNFKNKASGTTSSLMKALFLAKNDNIYENIIEDIKRQHLLLVEEVFQNKENVREINDYIELRFNDLYKLLDDIKKVKDLNKIYGKVENEIAKSGEELSAFILAKLLCERNIKAEYVSLSNIFTEITYSSNNKSFFNNVETKIKELLNPLIDNDILPIVTGYCGEWIDGIIRTIGRGYSDLTATFVASSLNADECQIWKDVDGIFTADPKSVTSAKLLSEISPEEASELTFLGSEVLHPYTLEQLMRSGIPLRICNTFKKDSQGTVIRKTTSCDATTLEKITADEIKSVTTRENVALINLVSAKKLIDKDYLSNVFNIFKNHNVFVNLISSSEVDLSVAVENSESILNLTKDLEKLGNVNTYTGYSTVSMVGRGLKAENGIAGKILSCLSDKRIPIKMISQGASQINISCLLESKYLNDALNTLHENFIINRNN